MVMPTVADVANGKPMPDLLPVSASPILSRLRLETQDAHKDLERILDFTGHALTHEAYRERLVSYYGFYAPLEAALRLRGGVPDVHPGDEPIPGETLAARLHKTPLLREDLEYLAIGVDAVPLCHDLPSLETPAERLGCLYVLEGATLGGKMIAQHLRDTLGITPATGGRFFEGYGSDTGTMWNAMRRMLSAGAVDAETEDAIVANAIATFTCLRRWCEPGTAAATDDAVGQAGAVPHA